MPYLEIVTIYPLTGDVAWGRALMHSFLGVLTVNLVLAAIAARSIGPWLATRLDRAFPGKGWRTFAGRDVVGDRTSWSITTASAILGGLTHLALDLLHHADTPLLWSWRPFPIHLGSWNLDPGTTLMASLVVNAMTGAIFVAMLLKWVGK